jgi:hypothetical protein
MRPLSRVEVVSRWYRTSKKVTFAFLVAFWLHFGRIFTPSMKAPRQRSGSGQRCAAAPGGAWNVAGLVLHRLPSARLVKGSSAGGQHRLITIQCIAYSGAEYKLKMQSFLKQLRPGNRPVCEVRSTKLIV